MLGSRLDAIENDLSDSGLYDDANKSKLLELLNEQSDIKAKIDSTEETMLAAMDELETLEADLA